MAHRPNTLTGVAHGRNRVGRRVVVEHAPVPFAGMDRHRSGEVVLLDDRFTEAEPSAFRRRSASFPLACSNDPFPSMRDQREPVGVSDPGEDDRPPGGRCGRVVNRTSPVSSIPSPRATAGTAAARHENSGVGVNSASEAVSSPRRIRSSAALAAAPPSKPSSVGTTPKRCSTIAIARSSGAEATSRSTHSSVLVAGLPCGTGGPPSLAPAASSPESSRLDHGSLHVGSDS